MTAGEQAAKRLLVIGGTGLLGRQICRAALVKGLQVTSLSLSGEPRGFSAARWVPRVNWQRGDVRNDPKVLAELLPAHDAVVNTVGILLESDYKGLVRGNVLRAPSVLKSLLQTATGHSNNPLRPKSEQGPTYESVNRDLAIQIAEQASATPSIKTHAYISAASHFPLVPTRYVTTKRQAEEAIAKLPGLRSIFMRPGFMFSEDRSISMPLRRVFQLTSSLNQITGKGLSKCLGAAGIEPIPAELVAIATVQAICDPSIQGPIDLRKIKQLCMRFRDE